MASRKHNSRESRDVKALGKEKRALKIRSANTRKCQKIILCQNEKSDTSLGENLNRNTKSIARKNIHRIPCRMIRKRLSQRGQVVIKRAGYRGTDSLDGIAKRRKHRGANDPFEMKKGGGKK